MPPPTGGKRKRGDRSYSGDSYSRPSPHRPDHLGLAQGQGRSPSNARDYNDSRGRGGRQSSRGGRGAAQASSPIRDTPEIAPPLTDSPAPQPEATTADSKMTTEPTDLSMTVAEPDILLPYQYIYVTDEICAAWTEQGKAEILEQATAALDSADDVKMDMLVQELLQSALTARLDPASSGDVIKDLLQHTKTKVEEEDSEHQDTDVETSVSDAVSIVYENNSSLRIDRLDQFLLATSIPPAFLRNDLDQGLLTKLDLVRATFTRVGTRKTTNVLYRQANFNLMREESEGFTKLMTELYTTSACDEPSGSHVEQSVEKVKALIGAFDLDVGRSLDVLLDVFGAVLLRHFRFFVKFLRTSPWWPQLDTGNASPTATNGLPLWALPGVEEWYLTTEQKETISQEVELRDQQFWEHARRDGLRTYYKVGLTNVNDGGSAPQKPEDDFSKAWIEQTGTIPPMGNKDAAQLLGFKLRYYSLSPARDDNDHLPDHLVFLSALLIKIGFISLKDLYPHLWRDDENMDELRKQKEKEKADRERASRPGAAVKNALLMAGALADDTIPAVPSRLRETSTRAGTPSKETEPEKAAAREVSTQPLDQKVALLKSLLAVGALPEALFILGRFPWVMDLYPDLSEYVNRILHHSLTQVYAILRPMRDRSSLQHSKPSYETDVPGVSKGQVKLVDVPERKTIRWAQLDRADSSDGTQYRYYWDEWNDLIPFCSTVDDVFTLCKTILPLVGVKIGQDPALVLKFARIGKHSLQVDTSEGNRARWLDLSKRILLPCLSLTKSNAGVVSEVFELISNFSTNTRYLMYLEWATGRTSRNQDVKAANDQARAETKDILKRISKTNIKPMARSLAKVAYANPHIVITTALAQIEVYDSIAAVFVEGARYFTDLGYDVLTWAMISSMARAGRSRTQEGGIFTSRWLAALAQFAGKIYKRYNLMRPAPLLQYVAQQLDQSNSTDLKMLEEIIAEMAGVAKDTSYNDSQLQAMGGGPLLQAQTILQLLDKRNDPGVRTSSRRLIKALQDTSLAGKFLLSMAQQRQACIFEEGDVPLKAIGNVYDEIHRIMVQYLEFLRFGLSVEEFAKAVPDVVDLLLQYGIQPEIAFWMCRPLISKQIVDHDQARLIAEKADGDLPVVNGDVDMVDQESSEEDGEAAENEDAVAAAATPDADLVSSNVDVGATDQATPVPGDQWHPVLREIMDGLAPTLPSEVLSTIGTGFYVSFWHLSVYDFLSSGESYQDELARQRRKIATIKADRSDTSLSGTRKKETETKAVEQLIENLLNENKEHFKALKESKARLQKEKTLWFAGKATIAEQLNTALLEYCILPRTMASPLDAYFCFKFLKFLHSSGTSNFRTVGFLDIFFRSARLSSLIFMCSSKEADNLGRFLHEALKELSKWHNSKTVYEREAWGSRKDLPGFALRVEGGKPVKLLDFESFRRILFKWHNQVYAALQKCITSPEYMHVRNAISILGAISAVFPYVNWHGTQLQKAVDKLRESDKEDLKVASQALLGALHRREKSWIEPQSFMQTRPGEEPPPPAEKKETPTEAKPSTEARTVKADEDGEVKDTTMTGTADNAAVKVDSKRPETKEALPSKSSSESSKLPSRPPTVNGSSTPRRDAASTDRPASRQHVDVTKTPGLPRKLSPPPRGSSAAAGLPSRPDSTDVRNGHRESPRIPSRPPLESTRPPHPRDGRPAYRGAEPPPADEFDRYARRHERPEPIPHASRDDRGYGREREGERAHGPRLVERERASDRDRAAPPAPSRGDVRDRPARGPPSRPLPSDSASRPPSTAVPARPPSSQSDTVGVNPARAALINSPEAPAPNMSIRGQAYDRPSRPSRGSSPRRDDERRGATRSDREQRPPAERRTDMAPNLQGPPTSSPPQPASRSDHTGRFPRDSRGAAQTVDMQHGRLEQDPSHRPPPRHERPAEAEVPSGPRGGRAPMSAPRGRGAPPLNTQNISSSSNDRPTPTGPSARHSRNNSYADNSVSAPPTPDTTGIHPSRLRQIDPSPTDVSRPAPAPAAPPPPPQGPPPAGPRGGNAPANAPSGPSPTTRGPPAGPQATEASGRGGRSSRNPLTAVNSTLSQAGQGSSIRGRGASRQASGTFNGHMPSGPSGHGPRSDGFQPAQQDLFGSSNPNGMPVGPRPASSRQETGRERRPEGDDRDSERRSTRRHGSREREAPRADREAREGKDDRETSRRDDRTNRRDENASHGDDRRGYRNPARDGPRDEPQSRKHGRGDEGGPHTGGGRGGSRLASESKRPRRGP